MGSEMCIRDRKQTNLQGLLLGPLAHVELSCSVVSCLSLLWTMCMCWRAHKVGRASWEGEAINNQYTQLGTCILGPILSAAHTRSPISIVSAKCRLQDSCNSARCAQHAHAHTTRVSQLQDASMLLWAFKWGFESDFVYVARPGPEYWEVEEDTSQVIF